MPVKPLPPSEGTADSRFGFKTISFERGEDSRFIPMEQGSGSLASSPDFGDMAWQIARCQQGGLFNWLPKNLLLDVDWVAQQHNTESRIQEVSRTQLANRLKWLFEEKPLEDGMDHAAEVVIAGALQSAGEPRTIQWLQEFCLNDETPDFAASVLRCIGRQARIGTDSWRTSLVRRALTRDDAEIRAAAVQAAETWGGQNIRNELARHSEPVPWLRSYIRDVIEDLKD